MRNGWSVVQRPSLIVNRSPILSIRSCKAGLPGPRSGDEICMGSGLGEIGRMQPENEESAQFPVFPFGWTSFGQEDQPVMAIVIRREDPDAVILACTGIAR